MNHNVPQHSSTGVPGLDDVLHGGLIAHRLYLVDGNPGPDKTTLALQFLREGIRAGKRCLYITLSETRDKILAGAASHGLSLDGVEIEELIGREGDLDGDAELTVYHPSEVELTETTRQVLETVQRINPSRMVFDSLSELRLLAQSSPAGAQSHAVAGRALRRHARDDGTPDGPAGAAHRRPAGRGAHLARQDQAVRQPLDLREVVEAALESCAPGIEAARHAVAVRLVPQPGLGPRRPRPAGPGDGQPHRQCRQVHRSMAAASRWSCRCSPPRPSCA